MGHDIYAKRVGHNEKIADISFGYASPLDIDFFALMGAKKVDLDRRYTVAELRTKWRIAHEYIGDMYLRRNVKHFLRMCIDNSQGDEAIIITFV